VPVSWRVRVSDGLLPRRFTAFCSPTCATLFPCNHAAADGAPFISVRVTFSVLYSLAGADISVPGFPAGTLPETSPHLPAVSRACYPRRFWFHALDGRFHAFRRDAAAYFRLRVARRCRGRRTLGFLARLPACHALLTHANAARTTHTTHTYLHLCLPFSLRGLCHGMRFVTFHDLVDVYYLYLCMLQDAILFFAMCCTGVLCSLVLRIFCLAQNRLLFAQDAATGATSFTLFTLQHHLTPAMLFSLVAAATAFTGCAACAFSRHCANGARCLRRLLAETAVQAFFGVDDAGLDAAGLFRRGTPFLVCGLRDGGSPNNVMACWLFSCAYRMGGGRCVVRRDVAA